MMELARAVDVRDDEAALGLRQVADMMELARAVDVRDPYMLRLSLANSTMMELARAVDVRDIPRIGTLVPVET